MKKEDLLATDIYCITAEKFSKGRSNLEVVKKMIAAGVKIIQYREKEKTMSAKYKECLEITELTKEAGVALIINDDIALALAVGADGVHVGQTDMPVEVVRDLVGDEMIIGLSTHAPKEARKAVEKGVDYIGVGPIFATDTKKDVCAPVGLEYLSFVAENIELPHVAIGGIKEHNLKEVLDNGAKTVAMVTEIVGANDIEKKIRNIKCKFYAGTTN